LLCNLFSFGEEKGEGGQGASSSPKVATPPLRGGEERGQQLLIKFIYKIFI
jgi:hypothetical protein